MDTLTTTTKIMTVFACRGKTCHVFSGLQLLKGSIRYVCPYCGDENIADITETPVGKAYFAFLRPDLYPLPRKSPPPLTP